MCSEKNKIHRCSLGRETLVCLLNGAEHRVIIFEIVFILVYQTKTEKLHGFREFVTTSYGMPVLGIDIRL